MSVQAYGRSTVLALVAALGAGCSDASLVADAGVPDGGSPDLGPDAAPPLPPRARVDYAGSGLYDAPFPDERLRLADGTVDVSGFPEGRSPNAVVQQLKATLDGVHGFGRSSGIFFTLTQPVDPGSLPDVAASVGPSASVFLMDVDPTSPDRGARWPVAVAFAPDGGPFGALNMLSLLPVQGLPLRPHRLYAAVLTTAVRTVTGEPLLVADATAMLVAGGRPAGLSDAAYGAHRQAIAGLVAAGVEPSTLAATAVVRTDDPMAGLRAARDQVLAETLPAPDAPFTPTTEVFTDYCVFHTTIRMPVFQGGTPPYAAPSDGGGWVYDASGALVVQDHAASSVWLTVPRAAMPAAGFPITVFARTGAGGDRPLVDRGAQAMSGGPALAPGTGPAMGLAQAGYAGISVDGPLGGLRNTAAWDEQFAIFNVNNPLALRDSIRQSALELILFAHVLPTLSVDASSCPGLSTPAGDGIVRFDVATLAMMSHSMGSTISPLAVALEPAFRALVASGAGASWIENVIYKTSPLDVRPLAEAILGYSGRWRLTEHDVVLSLLQWAGEPADPQLYASLIVTEPPSGGPRDVLMFQGLLDTYIPPPVANALTLSLGLDLAGPELDVGYPEYAPLSSELALAGGTTLTFPVSGNRNGGATTAVLTQHPSDGIEDAHEVVFQTGPPKRQYRCFLASRLATVARVPDGAGDPATCD